jgi:hypothetical protein
MVEGTEREAATHSEHWTLELTQLSHSMRIAHHFVAGPINAKPSYCYQTFSQSTVMKILWFVFRAGRDPFGNKVL